MITATAQALTQRLRERLDAHPLEVIDESEAHAGHAGTEGRTSGTHFRVRLSSPKFKGLRQVAQHRLVYDALQDYLDAGLHALAIEILPSPSEA